ncbi:MAG: helix-turn-helix domain-containing protein [Chthoniobacteraceae bacterium]|jgi:excisionase family DNA binding protein
MPQPITKLQLADKFGVSLSTVNEWLKSGRIAHLKVGRMVKFTAAHVEAFERAHTVKAVV